MTQADIDAIWNVFEGNMKTLYETSSLGWNPAEKRKELFHTSSRFILAYRTKFASDSPGAKKNLVGFSMFRFECEDEEAVVYCYELQVCLDTRGLGLGRTLMGYLEAIGEVYEMEKTMLTVLKANENAVGFYNKYGFEVDPTSPSLHGEEVDYEILSKEICPEWTSE